MQGKWQRTVQQLLLATGILCTATALQASTFLYTFNTVAANDSDNEPLLGKAVFQYSTADPNNFTVTLYNDVSNIHSAGQLLSDLEFNVAGTVTFTGSNADYLKVASNGSKSTPTPGSGVTGWGFGSLGSDNWIVCVICATGADNINKKSEGPDQTIISDQANYSTAASSITGTTKGNKHSPFLAPGAVFDFYTTVALNASGVTTPFSNVFLSFGTTAGDEIDTNMVPEPISLILAGGGLIGIAMIKRRRGQSANR